MHELGQTIRDDYNLKEMISNLEIDPIYGVPVLHTKEDHYNLQSRLFHPENRDFEKEDLGFYQIFTNDNYTPGEEIEPTIEGAYCQEAEGELDEAGWNALAHTDMVKTVCMPDDVRVTELTYVDGNMHFTTIHPTKKILLKRNWKPGYTTLPTGLFFENNQPFICSPVVIALFYDDSGMPRFIYDKFRASRPDDINRAEGFVWKIRPSTISSYTKLKLIRHLAST